MAKRKVQLAAIEPGSRFVWQNNTYILLRFNEETGNAVALRLPPTFEFHEENFNPYADVIITHDE